MTQKTGVKIVNCNGHKIISSLQIFVRHLSFKDTDLLGGNLRPWGIQSGGLEVQGHPQVHSK